MAAPLFIRVPITSQGDAAVDAEFATVLHTADGPTLIERIIWADTLQSTDATLQGYITLLVQDYGGDEKHLKHILVGAHDPSTLGPLCGEIELGLTLADGWSLLVTHTVSRGVPGDVTLSFVAQGGELG